MMDVQVAPNRAASDKELKGWHVLLIMLGFFGVMFAVNGVFLYHAITSFPGEDVKKSYVQGLSYNDTLAAREAQAELGWTAQAGHRGSELIFRLQDRDGAPLSNYVVVGELRRFATQKADQAIAYSARPDGEYVAEASALAPGQWALRINVLDAEAETVLFNVTKTIIVS